MTTQTKASSMVIRADHVPGPPQGCWTYADYAALPDDGNRYEIIHGVLYQMPGPTFIHQAAVLRFGSFLFLHVEQAGRGRVLIAPFDVELIAGRAAVQPDVTVVLTANLGIITAKRIIGAPDLVVEVASPGTAGHDRRLKQDAYAEAGVPEYWIADPSSKTVEVLVLADGAYHSLKVYEDSEPLVSRVLPELAVTVDQFFA